MLPEPALSRRGFLASAGALLGGSLLSPAARAAAFAPAAPHRFVSRPDLRPPVVSVTTASEGAAEGLVFIAPFQITGRADPRYGALIVDERGEPIWFKPEATKTAMNLRVQKYRGSRSSPGTRASARRRLRRRVRHRRSELSRDRESESRNGEHGDLHEFLLTSRGTALITIYSDVPADLTSVGGPANGQLTEGVIQEIDVGPEGADRMAELEGHRPRRVRTSRPSRGRSPTTSTSTRSASIPTGTCSSPRETRRRSTRFDRQDRQDHVAPRRETERLHDRSRGGVLVPARRPAAHRRDADDLRQQRRRPGVVGACATSGLRSTWAR